MTVFKGAGAGQTFYENLCYKAVNQCIGRAVRHKNDYATVLLVDERYNRIGTKNSLPDWIKRSLQVANFQETFTQITKVNNYSFKLDKKLIFFLFISVFSTQKD